MSPLVALLAILVVIPAAVALAIALAGLPWRGDTPGRLQVAGAAAVFAAHLVGSWGLVGPPRLAPHDISHWSVHASALGLIASIALQRAGQRVGLRWALRAAIALAVAYLAVRPLLASRWHGATAALVVAGAAATLLVYWLMLDAAVRRAGGARLGATVLLIASAAVAAGTAASGTVVVAELGGAAVAGVGALWLIGFRWRQLPLVAGPIPVVAAAGWWMAALGVGYASMSRGTAVALLAIPLVALAAGELSSRLSIRRRAVSVLIAAVAAAAAAVGLAASASSTDADASDPAADYGYE